MQTEIYVQRFSIMENFSNKPNYNDYINYGISIEQNVMQPSVITFMLNVNDMGCVQDIRANKMKQG